MRPIFIILIIHLYFGNIYSGEIKGYIYRKANTTAVSNINRYSIRNTVPDETKSSSSNDMAIVYLTSEKIPKGKPEGIPKVKQENLSFDPWLLPVYVGTTVEFPNMDLVFHNVFSYSKTKKFDLGRYGKGESKKVVFDKPGLVKVFCEIHKTMRAYILVLETPYFTTTDKTGYFDIADVPDGEYTLHVWQENTEEYTETIKLTKDQILKIEIN